MYFEDLKAAVHTWTTYRKPAVISWEDVDHCGGPILESVGGRRVPYAGSLDALETTRDHLQFLYTTNKTAGFPILINIHRHLWRRQILSITSIRERLVEQYTWSDQDIQLLPRTYADGVEKSWSMETARTHMEGVLQTIAGF